MKKNIFLVSKLTRIWQILIRKTESVKIDIFMGSFCPKQNTHELQTYRGVVSNEMKNDEKSEEELTCRFKTGRRNVMNFDSRTQKSQKFTL